MEFLFQIWNKHCLFETKGEVEPYLGVLDAVFMISYAVGLYISGMLGDRFNMRYVLSIGMCSSAVMVFIFGVVFEWAHYYNKYMYVFLWILNGLLQSTGWPTVVAVMGNWFGRSSRGLILGLWSACASVGNIIGAFMVSSVLDYGYQYAFLLTSSALFAGGVINFFGLLSSPKEVGLPMPDEENSVIQRDYTINDRESDPLLGDDESDSEIIVSPVPPAEERPKALGFCKALCLPGVALYALAYACLKLVNYSFFFWLPYYLTNKYGWKQTVADDISIWYDVGGIIGDFIQFLFHFFQDRFQKRSVIVIPMLLLGIPSLFIYNSSLSSTKLMNSVLMSVVGFFIGGVANLVSAAISADLGRQGPVQGNAEALATVTGIVDGTGSVGAAIGQILVPVIEDGLGWKSVFYLFMIMRLGCPYTEGIQDDGWIAELIYAPGEPRINLLQWLFVRFDSSLHEVLDPQPRSTGSRMDSRIQRLLFVASTLGLCSSEDVDLIRGVTKGSKQDAFLGYLLDIVCLCQETEGTQLFEERSTCTLDNQFSQCCSYVDRLVIEQKVDNFLNPRVNLLPPDLMKKYDASCNDQGFQRDRPPKVDLHTAQHELEQLQKDIDRQTEILSELDKQFNFCESDEMEREKTSKTLSLTLSEMSQLLTGFSYCFENDMRQWCNKTPPDLTQLGPAFKRVHQSFPTFLKLLKDYETIRSSYTKVDRDASKSYQSAVQGSCQESQTKMFEEWANVIEDSIKRQRKQTVKSVKALWNSSLTTS
ncbi:hypothetical protein FSP39_019433 [Pinctada imbricata]|uniref:Major facilitator superfamily (MFS) profile domain-containing protein n=1 Tax=Pinctada imbricata TaxID=66713 RepID=A0AA88YRX9_PINIB|nr:hypothetical protein FSP39_019433 [Pinctada imbricata]